MIPQPQMWEWIYLYVPMAVALIFACVQEIRTERIKNWLSGVVLLYLVVQRLIHEPAGVQDLLMGIGVAFGVVIVAGWMSGTIGGGCAKLAIAVCAGLPFIGSVYVSLLLVGLSRMTGNLRKWLKFEGLVPGSIMLTIIVFIVVGSSLLRDRV